MGQNRQLFRLKQLLNKASDGNKVMATHGYFEEVDRNVLVVIPKPPTYELGLINELTGTPKPDGTETYEGSLEYLANKLESILNDIDGN